MQRAAVCLLTDTLGEAAALTVATLGSLLA